MTRITQDIRFLAAPAQEGRGIGSVGQQRAAWMIESRLRSMGLTPALSNRSFRQPFSVPATQPASTQPVEMVNIVAERVGWQRDECVVIGAHYDHIGYGGKGSAAPWSHALHPGADDNASGVAAVLALAQRIAAGPKPRRTTLFVLFAGEERGLLGADYFVRHPPRPLSQVKAMLNFDMVGRLRDHRVFVGGQQTAKIFPPILRASREATNIEVKVFSLGGGGPSDHRAFSERRVPVLFFFTGLHADYHTPRDAADAVNYEGVQSIVNMASACIQQIDRAFDLRYCDEHDHDASILTPVDRRPAAELAASLTESSDRVRVERLAKHAQHGEGNLSAGDMVVEADGKIVRSISDLRQCLRTAMPGDEFRLLVRRQGRMIQVTTTLVQRKDRP